MNFFITIFRIGVKKRGMQCHWLKQFTYIYNTYDVLCGVRYCSQYCIYLCNACMHSLLLINDMNLKILEMTKNHNKLIFNITFIENYLYTILQEHL